MTKRLQEIEDSYKNLLHAIKESDTFNESLVIEDIVKTSFKLIQQLFDVSFLTLGVYNNRSKGLDLLGISKEKEVISRRFEDMKDSNRWSVYCYQSQQDILFSGQNHFPEKHFSNLLFNDSLHTRESFIYVPLTMNNKQMGVLSVQSIKKNEFTQQDVEKIKILANYISLCLISIETKNELKKVALELEEARNYFELKISNRTDKIKKQKKEIEEQNRNLSEQREMMLKLSKTLEEINTDLERQSMVARKTDNAIMVMDAVGNILWLNECFNRLYEYTHEKFQQVRGTNILQTSFNPNIGELLDKCITTKQVVHYDALNVKGDGTEVWTHTTLTPVLNDEGDITHLLTIDTDITELKEAQLKIEKQSLDITNSIHYAARIQKAVLPSKEELKQLFSDYFVIYRPRNIVSGDFYWHYQKNDKIVIAVADCTGHGVPGGFMSMLGIAFLNEIVASDSLRSAAQVLELLRLKVKLSLRQTGKINETSDGMDIALIIADTKREKLFFSGAFNKLLLNRNGKVTEYQGNKMPIGIYISDNIPFTDHVIDFKKDDCFYLFTDGVIDQFGGPNDRKFSLKKLKSLVTQNGSLAMKEQKKIYNDALDNWMGSADYQIDDICFMGFKF